MFDTIFKITDDVTDGLQKKIKYSVEKSLQTVYIGGKNVEIAVPELISICTCLDEKDRLQG